ncbi:ATP-binding protein [Oceanobacillus sojae]|uniref:Sensor histidine kinase MalK n=1 Tax=Oceanobacillus sojae TaxID=582851 RepID=A0A511ZMW2_9BACI|nr:ATP-binding protein [Oceanobacillus sojae]GEN88781.1 sensor histidine kinase MalK [Oceanobacillus sojae]
MRKKDLPLMLQMMLFTSGLICFTLLVTGILIGYNQASETKEALADKASLSASHFARMPIVVDALEKGEAGESLRSIAAEVRESNDLQYIVLMDMKGIRLMHPVPERIGEHFVGGDVDAVLEGQRYTSEAVGTLGPSMRAFEPVYNQEGTQIGAISVGISTKVINQAVWDSLKITILGTVLSLGLGLTGSYFLARRLKKTLFDLEPQEIAYMIEEREAMLDSVSEGVIAINADHQIIIANPSSGFMLERAGYHGNIIGEKIIDVWPELSLEVLLNGEKAVYDKSVRFGNAEMITNSVSFKVDKNGVGALVTFRDRNELDAIMKKLSGVESYAHTLRMQTHEFMNKLHIIGAMVYTESYEELAEYVDSLSQIYQRETGMISAHIDDVAIAGYLLTKLERLEQLQIDVDIQGENKWPSLSDPTAVDRWITIIGNSLENAVDAMVGQKEKKITLVFDVFGEALFYEIRDNGAGFNVENLPSILEKGYSTKGLNRGYGMTIMINAIKAGNGTYHIQSKIGAGTCLQIKVPYEHNDEERNNSK